jgi:hypothetical protein
MNARLFMVRCRLWHNIGAMTIAQAMKLAMALAAVEKSTSYGAPSVKTGGRMFACKATNKSAEPNSLAVMLDFDDRDALIAEDPETYYLKPHYVNYPCVLVRLNKVHPDAMKDLLAAAHRYVSAKGRRRKGPSRAAEG